MGKKLKKLFCITFVMIFISSTFLLSGCLVKVYEASPLFTFLHQTVNVNTIDSVHLYFEFLAKNILSGLMDNYGPTTTSIFDQYLAQDYENRTIVSFSQLLSRAEYIATYNYQTTTNNSIQITALSSMPVVFNNIGCSFSQDGSNVQVFEWNSASGEITCCDYLAKISGNNENIRGFNKDSKINLLDYNLGYNQFYVYQAEKYDESVENYMVTGDICLFYVEQHTTYDKNALSALLGGNCNVSYKDNQGLPEVIESTSINIPQKKWKYPLQATDLDFEIFWQQGSHPGTLYNMEKAKESYVSDDLIGRLACILIKTCLFGYSTELDSILGSGLAYYKPTNNNVQSSSKKESVINDDICGLALKELYEVVMTGGNINGNDYTAEYSVFIRSAILFMTGDVSSYFENNTQRILSSVLNDIIGIEEGYYVRNYATTVQSIIENSINFYYTNITSSCENGKLKLYSNSFSSKTYNTTLQDELTLSSYSSSKYSSWNNNLQSVIINSKSKSKSRWEWENGDNPFEGDEESENEFRKEYTNGDDGTPSLDISKLTISLTLNNQNCTQDAYARLENIKIYLLTYSGTAILRTKNIELLTMAPSWDSGKKILTFVYVNRLSITSFCEENYPPLYNSSTTSQAKIAFCEDNNLIDGYGAYYDGFSNQTDHFAELIFVRPENFNINISICGIKLS